MEFSLCRFRILCIRIFVISLLRNFRDDGSRYLCCLHVGLSRDFVEHGSTRLCQLLSLILIKLSISSLSNLLELLSQLCVSSNLLFNLGSCLLTTQELLDELNSSVSSLFIIFKFVEKLNNFELISLNLSIGMLWS